MKTGTGRHPKTLRLMQALKINRREAVGLLELLWEFTAEYSPDGDLSRWGSEAIASAVDWFPGRGTELVDGLLRAGWLDRGEDAGATLIVHDWRDHCPEYVKKRILRRSITKQVTQNDLSDKRQTNGGQRQKTADNGGQCLPTQPNPTNTQPNQTHTTACAREGPGAVMPEISPAIERAAFEVFGAMPTVQVAEWVMMYPQEWLLAAFAALQAQGKRGIDSVAYCGGILRRYAKQGGSDAEIKRGGKPPTPADHAAPDKFAGRD